MINEIEWFVTEAPEWTRDQSITIIECGWGNGYVSLPSSHPCYGVDYNQIYSLYGDGMTCQEELTFAGTYPKREKKGWVIGFDTMHLGQNIHNYPKERVEAEAKKLAEDMWLIWVQHQKKISQSE